MDKLTAQCKELNMSILESDEYKNYIYARKSIKLNEELYRAVCEFKRQYGDILRYSDGNPYDELLRLYYDYDELLHNSVVNEYLRAESTLSKMIRKIIDQVIGGVKFEE